MITRRRLFAGLAAGGLAAGGVTPMAAPALAQAKPRYQWRMATAWPRTLLGPATSARRLAKRIETLSEGQIAIEVFSAGEIVPAFSVFDAVSIGTVELGHTAAFFIAGKIPASPFFTTVPFGLSPLGHLAWLDAGGGQALWDTLYADFGVKPFIGGNTGASLGGWFRKPLQGLEDVKGLRLRVTGMGGELYRRLGAVPQTIPPGDVYPALERGTIDAVELLGPMNDRDLGLYRIAPYVMMPGFNKPNGASEFLIQKKLFADLPDHLQQVIETACEAEHAAALAEAQLQQAQALESIAEQGAHFMMPPKGLLQQARRAASDILVETAATSVIARAIVESYTKAQKQMLAWDRLTYLPPDLN